MKPRKLDYSGQQLTDDDLRSLHWAELDDHYQEVDFSNNQISSKGLQTVLDFCHRCEHLRILKLFRNNIGDKGAQGLAILCRELPGLEEIHLSHNNFTGEGVEHIVSIASRSRGDNDVPLWLRMELNIVKDVDGLVHHLTRAHSVCDRRNERACTNRICKYGCKVHIPHIWKQRKQVHADEVDDNVAPRSITLLAAPRKRPRSPPMVERPRSPELGYNHNSRGRLQRPKSRERHRRDRRDREDRRDHRDRRDVREVRRQRSPLPDPRQEGREPTARRRRRTSEALPHREPIEPVKRRRRTRQETTPVHHGYRESRAEVFRRPSPEVVAASAKSKPRRPEATTSHSQKQGYSSKQPIKRISNSNVQVPRQPAPSTVPVARSYPVAAVPDPDADYESYSYSSDSDSADSGQLVNGVSNGIAQQAIKEKTAMFSSQKVHAPSNSINVEMQSARQDLKQDKPKEPTPSPPPGVSAMVGLSSSSEDDSSDDEEETSPLPAATAKQAPVQTSRGMLPATQKQDKRGLSPSEQRWAQDRGCSPPSRSGSSSSQASSADEGGPGAADSTANMGSLKERMSALKSDLGQKLPRNPPSVVTQHA